MVTKILIADDSKFMRGILSKILNKEGFEEIIEARDGKQAIQLFKDKKPDITFMDIMMPKKSGLQAIMEIIKENPKAKIVIVSSLDKSRYEEILKDYSLVDFVLKPFKGEDIKNALIKANLGK